MAKRWRNTKDIEDWYKQQELKADPHTPYPLAISLRTGGKPKGGYLTRLYRQQRKCVRQLRGLPGCGPTLRDWMTGY